MCPRQATSPAKLRFALWEKHLHIRGENVQAQMARPTLQGRKETKEPQSSGRAAGAAEQDEPLTRWAQTRSCPSLWVRGWTTGGVPAGSGRYSLRDQRGAVVPGCS